MILNVSFVSLTHVRFTLIVKILPTKRHRYSGLQITCESYCNISKNTIVCNLCLEVFGEYQNDIVADILLNYRHKGDRK